MSARFPPFMFDGPQNYCSPLHYLQKANNVVHAWIRIIFGDKVLVLLQNSIAVGTVLGKLLK